MRRLRFTKSSNLTPSNDPSHIIVTFDENGVATSLDNIGNRTSIGALINSNRQTATPYTLALSDGGKIVEMNLTATNSVIIPTNASASFQIGTQILVTQYGTGSTAFTYSSPVTVRAAGSRLRLSSQYSAATLLKINTNEWYLFGDTTS
jgi:hypothetical protein